VEKEKVHPSPMLRAQITKGSEMTLTFGVPGAAPAVKVEGLTLTLP
jgi:hypothetical protein